MFRYEIRPVSTNIAKVQIELIIYFFFFPFLDQGPTEPPPVRVQVYKMEFCKNLFKYPYNYLHSMQSKKIQLAVT